MTYAVWYLWYESLSSDRVASEINEHNDNEALKLQGTLLWNICGPTPVRSIYFHLLLLLLLLQFPTQPSIKWVLWALIPGVKQPGLEVDHSPPSSTKLNKCSYTSTSQYVLMTCCLIKHRDNFTFTVTSLLLLSSSSSSSLFQNKI